eukprot:3618078-Rhodomonas_salina.1
MPYRGRRQTASTMQLHAMSVPDMPYRARRQIGRSLPALTHLSASAPWPGSLGQYRTSPS